MEHNGEPVTMLLDLVEVSKSHSGKNLAEAFEKVLRDFGISDKAGFFFSRKKIDDLPLSNAIQILSVTCDNASNNDKMIEEMASRLEIFPGAANQTRCFLHILNLTVKTILRQFEIPQKINSKETNGDGDREDLATNELLALSSDIEDDYTSPYKPNDKGAEDDEDEDEDDNEEGWVDERLELTAEQIAELEEDMLPVRLMITKVWNDSAKKKNSNSRLSASRSFEHNEELVNYYPSSVDG